MNNLTPAPHGTFAHGSGFHAGVAGRLSTENPYGENNPDAVIWMHGWKLGDAERGKKKP